MRAGRAGGRLPARSCSGRGAPAGSRCQRCLPARCSGGAWPPPSSPPLPPRCSLPPRLSAAFAAPAPPPRCPPGSGTAGSVNRAQPFPCSPPWITHLPCPASPLPSPASCCPTSSLSSLCPHCPVSPHCAIPYPSTHSRCFTSPHPAGARRVASGLGSSWSPQRRRSLRAPRSAGGEVPWAPCGMGWTGIGWDGIG